VKLPTRKTAIRFGLCLGVATLLGGGGFLWMFPWVLENEAMAGVQGPSVPIVAFEVSKGDIGAAAYGRACGYCHDTQIGPSLRGRELDPETVKYFARRGSRAMPAFRRTDISDAELDAIAALVAGNKLPELRK